MRELCRSADVIKSDGRLPRVHDYRHYSGTRIIPATEPKRLLFRESRTCGHMRGGIVKGHFESRTCGVGNTTRLRQKALFVPLRADAGNEALSGAYGGERIGRYAEPPIQRSRLATL